MPDRAEKQGSSGRAVRRTNFHTRRRVFTLDDAFASVPPLGNEGDFKRIIREAKEERAGHTLRKITEYEPEGEP
jgi:hypothetical protein